MGSSPASAPTEAQPDGDLMDLPSLTDAALLEALRLRHAERFVYTYAGPRVVASVIIALAVNSMHYTGMASATYFYTADVTDALTHGLGSTLGSYTTRCVRDGLGLSPAATQLAKAEADVKRAQRAYRELLAAVAPLRR